MQQSVPRNHLLNLQVLFAKVKILNLTALLALVMLAADLCASNVISDVSESESYVFEYTPINTEKTEVNNFFIKELAKYNLTSLYNTRFTYHYSMNRIVSELDELSR